MIFLLAGGKNNLRWQAWPALLALLLWAAAAFAQNDLPPRPNPPRLVNDFAGMLAPDEEEALERKLVAYDDSTSSQITIVTINNLNGYDVSDYAFKLGDAWGIGRAQKNNGILILVAKEERKMYIATGYGLEGALPDALAKRIIETILKPNFQQSRYYQGLNEATDYIIGLASGEYEGEPRSRNTTEGNGIPFWAIILIILVILWLISRRGGGGGKRTITSRGTRGWGPVFFPMGGGGFGGGFGGGGFGGGGGGFGGFGGGKFGGGGAGGSW